MNNTKNVWETLSDLFQNHPIIFISITLLSVAGSIGTIYSLFFIKMQRPRYHVSSINIITSHITEKASGLKITYDCEEINNLTISKIGFINLGKQVIDKNDIPPKGRFYLQFNERIYDKRILFSTEEANNFSIFQIIDVIDKNMDKQEKINILKKYSNRIYFDFEYLAKNEGGVIQIAHSGSIKRIKKLIVGYVFKVIKLYGTLKGVKPKFLEIDDVMQGSDKWITFWLAPATLLLYSLTIFGVIRTSLLYSHIYTENIIMLVFFFSAVLLLLLITTILVYVRLPYPAKLIKLPSKNLSEYYQNFNRDWDLDNTQLPQIEVIVQEEIDGINFQVQKLSRIV